MLDEHSSSAVIPIVTSRAGRVLSGLGGALGVLPFLALARSLAFHIFAASSLPGAEMAAWDVKEATYLEAGVLVLLVPLAAFLGGWKVPRFLRSRGYLGSTAYVPGVLFGGSFLFWKAGLGATGALVTGAVLALAGIMLGRRVGWGAGVLLGVLVIVLGALAYMPGPVVNLFEDGQILTNAQSLAHGERPFVDVYPVHGWGADGGWDAVLFRLFPNHVGAFRTRRAIMMGVALAALYFAGWLLTGDPRWGLLSLVAALAFCPVLSERQSLALVCVSALIWAARALRSSAWWWAGVGAGALVFATWDLGVMILAAGIFSPLTLALLRAQRIRAVRATAWYLLGVLAGAVPFLGLLLVRGSLAAFLGWVGDISREAIPAWGLPAVSLAQLARDGNPADFIRTAIEAPPITLGVLLLVLVASTIVFLFRRAARAVDAADRAAAVCLVVATVALRGVLGRADVGHRLLYGIFTALLITWLVYRAADSEYRRLLIPLALSGFVAFTRPDRTLTVEVSFLRQLAAQRHDPVVWIPGVGNAARSQAEELGSLRAILDGYAGPSSTFIDFGGEPGLYFLLQRTPPIRYLSVPWYETEAKQREVITALERVRPKVAILASGTHLDAFDNIASRSRAPLVAQYLDTHYVTLGVVGKRTVAVRRVP